MNILINSIFIFVSCNWMILVNTQVEVSGVCPADVVQFNFSLESYLGKWYEIKRYNFTPEEKEDCVISEYKISPDGTGFTVDVKLAKLTDNTIRKFNGTGRLFSMTHPHDGRLIQTFENVTSEYWVLNTDYKNYAVVWSCEETGGNSKQSAWILSRSNKFSPEIEAKVISLFPALHLNSTWFRDTEQSEKKCKIVNSTGSQTKIIDINTLTIISILITRIFSR